MHRCLCVGSWIRQHQISGEYWWNGLPAPQSTIHFQLDATGRAEQEICSQGPLGWMKEESSFTERVSLLTSGSFVIPGQVYSNHMWCPACNLCFSWSHCKRPSYDLLCWICLSGPKTSRGYCPLGNLPRAFFPFAVLLELRLPRGVCLVFNRNGEMATTELLLPAQL